MKTTRSTNPKKFLSTAEAAQVVEAIRAAERGTTGEVRLRLEQSCRGAALDRARVLFDRLGMNRTGRQNGVLVYLSLADRQFAIFGDAGIDGILGPDGWQKIRDRMASRFQKGKFVEGLIEAITAVGTVLATHFPAEAGDRNELTDDISFGD